MINLCQHCPKVPGLDSPGNIFHTYVTKLLTLMDPHKAEQNIGLVMINKQVLDSTIYRYIFKVTKENGKHYFIGILSQIKSDENSDINEHHNIVRYIESSDMRDAQRLLGIYDATEDDEIDCGNMKEKFELFTEQNPFELDYHLVKPEHGGTITHASNQQKNHHSDDFHKTDNKQSVNHKQQDSNHINHPLIIKNKGENIDQNYLDVLIKKITNISKNEHSISNTVNQNDAKNSVNDLLHIINTKGPTQQKPLIVHNPSVLKTEYQLGSVLSGTGKDKIYHKNSRNKMADSSQPTINHVYNSNVISNTNELPSHNIHNFQNEEQNQTRYLQKLINMAGMRSLSGVFPHPRHKKHNQWRHHSRFLIEKPIDK